MILVFGFLFLAVLNRQKLNLVVTGKEWIRIQTKQGLKDTWKYMCSYAWYNPKPVDTTKLPTKPDDEEKNDKKWFQGGAVKLEKGESMKTHLKSIHIFCLRLLYILS